MYRLSAAFAALFLASAVCAFTPSNIGHPRSVERTALRMAIDYNDPVVAEEFANVQPMAFEDVEAELRQKGIPVPPTMK